MRSEHHWGAVYRTGWLLTAPGYSEKGFTVGQTIPVKFDLTDANRNTVTTAAATLAVNGRHYQDHLDTAGLPVGNLTLAVTLDDGATYSVTITLTARAKSSDTNDQQGQ